LNNELTSEVNNINTLLKLKKLIVLMLIIH
jgi:hypothetical protein